MRAFDQLAVIWAVNNARAAEKTTVCRPTIRGHRSGPWDRRYGAGPWTYGMKCYDCDTSWTSKNRGTWQDALDLASEHHQERARGRFDQP